MRKDMKRVVITRPRHGSKLKNLEVTDHRRRARDGDGSDLPQKSSMKPKGKNSWHKKELSDFLNPLIGFLRKNCGRSWNKVYSEISENLDRRGVINAHVFQHLETMVTTKPIWKNEIPHRPSYNGLQELYKDDWGTFYVDIHGMLRQPKHNRPKYKHETNPNKIKRDNHTYICSPEGVWFELIALSENHLGRLHPPPQWVKELFPHDNMRYDWGLLRAISKKEKKTIVP